MDGIEIRALKKWYGDTHALDGLDLDAAEGEILGVAGPNGAGKSTLIRILVKSGDHVRTGQPLMVIDPLKQAATVEQQRAIEAQKKAVYDYAATELERQRSSQVPERDRRAAGSGRVLIDHPVEE